MTAIERSAVPEITEEYMQAMLAQSKPYTALLLRVTEKVWPEEIACVQ